MRFLFFDMEFANGQVPGSIYSLGYVITDEEFCVLEEPRDLLIDPECQWNAYVEQNILAYPKEKVEEAPSFPEVYGEVRALFDSVDVAVGFSVSNDNRALQKDCERYGLEALSYRHFDVEKLCRMQEEHKEAHGLSGYYAAWCGEAPDHQHRSDGDAVATMELLKKICTVNHVTAEMIVTAYPECVGDSSRPAKKREVQAKKPRRRRGRRGGKQKRNGGKEASAAGI